MRTKKLLTLSKYVPGKVAKLQNHLNQIGHIMAKVDGLQEEIVLDLIEGWTTGDNLLDFVLTANNGVYDEFSLVDYEKVANLGLRHPNQVIMVAQICIHRMEDEYISFIKNIYLATLRQEETHFDLDKMTIGIPVQANYLAWMETTKEGLLFSGHKLVQNTFLEVGPVSNEFCDNSYTHNAGDDFYRAAEDAPCYIELLPLDSVFVDYGITDEHIVYLMKLWTKLKSTNSALASR